MEAVFPLSQAALHPGWPAAQFHVGGLFTHDRAVMLCLGIAKDLFNLKLPIKSIYGCPPMIWNCGRPFSRYENGFKGYTPVSLDVVEQSFSLYNKLGISCNLVFSNPLLNEEHLEDSFGNDLLQLLSAHNEHGNGVILSSLKLLEHVRQGYPELNVIASVLFSASKPIRTSSYYATALDLFDRIVVHPDDNNNEELLASLPLDFSELLVNEYCLPQCALRPMHYELIAKASLEDLPPDAPFKGSAAENLEAAMRKCNSMPLSRQASSKQCNIVMTETELRHIYNMGFRHFKLQGRKSSNHLWAFDLMRYTLEPQRAFPLAYAAFCEKCLS